MVHPDRDRYLLQVLVYLLSFSQLNCPGFMECLIHKHYNFYPVGASALSQRTHYMKIQSKVQILEERTKEAERTAELAEADAREKDKELVETLKRLYFASLLSFVESGLKGAKTSKETFVLSQCDDGLISD